MIKLTKANKYFNRGKTNQIHVINDTDLELPDTGMIAIFGKSGCGKTTLLNAIGGLDKLDSGSITIFGQDLRSDPDLIRNKYIGYIFQNYNLSKDQTVYENVANALRLCGVTDEAVINERVMAALESTGMEKFFKRLPGALSGGQQQRVAISRAIVKNPAIILADEPTGNLDEANTIMIMDMLKAISKEHLVLLVTHEANLVDYYCDRVIGIVDGKIASDDTNSDANGYVQKDKNVIYLGEYEKRTASIPGVELEYYGDAPRDITLRIINVGGKIYLETNTTGIRMLDESSEIKLKEGVFEEKVRREESALRFNTAKLPRVEGTVYGKLFGFKRSFAESYALNFTQKIKKGNRFLRIMLVLLAFIIVFASAHFAVFIRDFAEIREKYNPGDLYISATKGDTSKVAEALGTNGIETLSFAIEREMDRPDTLSFVPGNFVSANISLSAEGFFAPMSQLPADHRMVLGTDQITDPSDMIITTAVADKIIKDSPASYIDSYSDLIGLVSSALPNYKIVGIVSSGVLSFYIADLYFADTVISKFYYNYVTAFSFTDVTDYQPMPGEAVVTDPYSGWYNYGSGESPDSVTVAGITYRVAKYIRFYDYYSQYPEFLKDNGYTIVGCDDYIKNAISDGSDLTEFQLSCEWFYNVYCEHMNEFIKTVLSFNPTQEAWMIQNMPSETWLIACCSPQDDYVNSLFNKYDRFYDIGGAEIYRKDKGSYPESVEILREYLDGNKIDVGERYKTMVTNTEYSFYNYQEKFYSSNNRYYNYCIILNDEDYKKLAYTAAVTDSDVIYSRLNDFLSSDRTYYSYLYGDLLIKIHSSDVKQTTAFLSENYSGTVITPGVHLESMLSSSIGDIVANAISLVVIIALMGLFIFFIMRSSFMSRVKEIGIYRAIGVSKRNIKFRFLVETMLITTLTVFIGYIIACVVLYQIISILSLSSLLYFPIWLAIVILALIYVICALCGLIPVAALLRKTPSAILAKYDI